MNKLKDVLQPGDRVYYREQRCDGPRYASKDLVWLLDENHTKRQELCYYDMETGIYIGLSDPFPVMDIVRVERNDIIVWLKEKAQRSTEGLSVKIVDGRLEITLGIDILKHAVTIGVPLDEDAVTDIDLFADAIMLELRREDEDGTTLVHRMLDKAATNAVENGCAGVKY